MLRLFGAQSTAVGKTVENFPPQWRAAAQWKSRGAETLVALQAQSPSGLKKAAQALRQAFSADLYGAGETTLPAAVVEALERHDKLLICADAAAGALLEARLENLPGAEKVFDFGAVSYANPKTGPLIEKRSPCPPAQRLYRPAPAGAWPGVRLSRRVWGQDLSAACAERESDCVLVLSCRKGCFLRTVPAGENPALWLLDIIRRTAANKPQAEGTGFLPARRAAKKDVLPGPHAQAASPAPGVHDAAGAGSAGGSRCGRGVGIYQRQFLRSAGTAAHPADGAHSPPGGDIGIGPTFSVIAAQCRRGSFFSKLTESSPKKRIKSIHRV